MQRLRVNTDFNGIVFFEPSRLRARYGGRVAAGADLVARHTTTDEGDDVLGAGLILPLLAPIGPKTTPSSGGDGRVTPARHDDETRSAPNPSPDLASGRRGHHAGGLRDHLRGRCAGPR